MTVTVANLYLVTYLNSLLCFVWETGDNQFDRMQYLLR